jgi:Sulfotransferase domain
MSVRCTVWNRAAPRHGPGLPRCLPGDAKGKGTATVNASAVTNNNAPHANRRVALISIPKSGTNLVLAILERALPKATTVDLMYPEPYHNGDSRRDYAFRANIAARKLIEETPGPAIFHTHATFSDYLMTTLWEFGVKPIFLMRDPRAVAVSFVDYVLKTEQHPAHRYFRDELHDFESRLRTAILGTDPNDPEQPFVPDLAGAWGRYIRWLRQPDILQLRYEGMVGKRFGGWDHRQRENVKRIVDFLGLDFSEEAFETLVRGGTDPKASVTFNKGGIHRWKKSFTPEMEALFQKEAGNILDLYQYKALDFEQPPQTAASE